jgi:hypothetical protein
MQLITFHACQYVSGRKSRCLSVDNGSNGMWRGEVESWPVCYLKRHTLLRYSGSMSGNFTSSCTLNPPACNLLVFGIASSNQACSAHAYRGGKVAWPSILIASLPYRHTGTRLESEKKHRHANAKSPESGQLRTSQLMATHTDGERWPVLAVQQ